MGELINAIGEPVVTGGIIALCVIMTFSPKPWQYKSYGSWKKDVKRFFEILVTEED